LVRKVAATQRSYVATVECSLKKTILASRGGGLLSWGRGARAPNAGEAQIFLRIHFIWRRWDTDRTGKGKGGGHSKHILVTNAASHSHGVTAS